MRNLVIKILGIIFVGVLGYGLSQCPLAQSPVSGFSVKNSALAAQASAAVNSRLERIANSVKPDKIRILIVPGHEPNYGGAEFSNLYERNLTVELGQSLQQFLQADDRYQVFITRDKQNWNPIFADYFKNNWDKIASWVKTSKESGLSYLSLLGMPTVSHNSGPTDVSLRLYGINKWANENAVDLVIHVHLNDYPGHSFWNPGEYSGLVIYTPVRQYSNSVKTRAIAETVFERLTKYNPVTNLEAESSGIVDDPELIAVGANNTAAAASMLIEYDYIYEPQFVNHRVRGLALRDLAYQTYLGLQDFFFPNGNKNFYNPALLYKWDNSATHRKSSPLDVYALQTALLLDGAYPPAGKDKNDCPRSGIFGECTRKALDVFQKENGITGENKVAGKKTFELLSKIYSGGF